MIGIVHDGLTENQDGCLELGGKMIFGKNWHIFLCIPSSPKIWSKSISHSFLHKRAFAFYEEIQDSHKNGRETIF